MGPYEDIERMDHQLRTIETLQEEDASNPSTDREYHNLQVNYQDTIAQQVGEPSPVENIHDQ